eukprot:g80347.t1
MARHLIRQIFPFSCRFSCSRRGSFFPHSKILHFAGKISGRTIITVKAAVHAMANNNVCTLHGKRRSASVLSMEPNGLVRCKPSHICQGAISSSSSSLSSLNALPPTRASLSFGPATNHISTANGQGGTCTLHNKRRNPGALFMEDGLLRCKPTQACKGASVATVLTPPTAGFSLPNATLPPRFLPGQEGSRPRASGSVAVSKHISSLKTEEALLALMGSQCQLWDEFCVRAALTRMCKLHKGRGGTDLNEAGSVDCPTAWTSTADNTEPRFLALTRKVQTMIETDTLLEGRTYANIAWNFATLKLPNLELFNATAKAVMPKLAALNPQQLVNLIWAFAQMNIAAPALFQSVAEFAVVRLNEFNSQNVANIVWAYAAAHQPAPELFQAVAQVAPKHLTGFNSQNLCNIVWAFSRHNSWRALSRPELTMLRLLCQDVARRLKASLLPLLSGPSLRALVQRHVNQAKSQACDYARNVSGQTISFLPASTTLRVLRRRRNGKTARGEISPQRSPDSIEHTLSSPLRGKEQSPLQRGVGSTGLVALPQPLSSVVIWTESDRTGQALLQGKRQRGQEEGRPTKSEGSMKWLKQAAEEDHTGEQGGKDAKSGAGGAKLLVEGRDERRDHANLLQESAVSNTERSKGKAAEMKEKEGEQGKEEEWVRAARLKVYQQRQLWHAQKVPVLGRTCACISYDVHMVIPARHAGADPEHVHLSCLGQLYTIVLLFFLHVRLSYLGQVVLR